MSSWYVRCLQRTDQLQSLAPHINALNLAAARPDPFATCEFYVNFLQHCGQTSQSGLWFLAVFRGSELMGYLALKQVTRKVLGVRTRGLEFLVGHQTDRPRLVACDEHAPRVAALIYEYLLRRRRDWSFLDLQGQTADSPLDPVRLGLRLPGCVVREFPNWDNCTLQLRWRSIQQYVHCLSKGLRYDLRRKLQRLQGLGRLEWLASSDSRVTPALFAVYRSIEARSWKSQTEIAIGSSQHGEYLKGLLDPQQPLQMQIQLLLLDGWPVAGLICGSFITPQSKSMHALYAAYDSRFTSAGPGSIMLLLAVRQAIEQGCDSLNMLAGFAYYKTRWLAEPAATRSIQVFRVGSLAFWRRMLGDARRALRRSVSVADDYNPLRREIEANDHLPRVTAGEQRRCTEVIEHLRERCVTLSAEEIVASMARPTAGTPDVANDRSLRLVRKPPQTADAHCVSGKLRAR